jgi:hypothetical protein
VGEDSAARTCALFLVPIWRRPKPLASYLARTLGSPPAAEGAPGRARCYQPGSKRAPVEERIPEPREHEREHLSKSGDVRGCPRRAGVVVGALLERGPRPRGASTPRTRRMQCKNWPDGTALWVAHEAGEVAVHRAPTTGPRCTMPLWQKGV